LKLTKDH